MENEKWFKAKIKQADLVVYSCIYNQFKRKTNLSGEIKEKDLFYILTVLHHFNKDDAYNVIAEMIRFNFIEAYKDGNVYYYKVV